MQFTGSEIQAYYSNRVRGLKKSGKDYRGPCPVHGGKNPNFSVNMETGLAYCHSACGRGFDILSLEMELSGLDFGKSKEAVFALLGRDKPVWAERQILDSYEYHDAEGKPIYRVVRTWTPPGEAKKFKQERIGSDGRWVSGLGDIKPVPFQLPKLIPETFAVVVEGEKDAINLTRAGIVATCNNGGAGNFKPELGHWFKGKRVGIIPDNDDPGRKHAVQVAALLYPHAISVRIIEIPGLSLKGDVTEFLNKGGDVEEIKRLFDAAQDWSVTWDYASDIPDENDKYVRTPAKYLEEVGGIDGFWSQKLAQGSPTPWKKLDNKLGGGMRPGEVYVIGANQGAGKTSLALQFAMHALKERRGVLLFSMEMSWGDVFQRMVSMEARVDLNEYREFQRQSSDSEAYREMRSRLNRRTWELTEYQLFVSNRTRVTPEYLMKESERLGSRNRIGLIIVDHMQLMGANGTVRGDYEKFTAISRATKETAMQLKVPLLLVSQTSRNNAHDKRLELDVSDLRGSGAIEEDAAAVMLLYDDKEDRERQKMQQTYHVGPIKTWLKLGKNRFGPSDCFMSLLHHKTTTQFEYMEQSSIPIGRSA